MVGTQTYTLSLYNISRYMVYLWTGSINWLYVGAEPEQIVKNSLLLVVRTKNRVATRDLWCST